MWQPTNSSRTLDGTPHSFVLACIMDIGIRFESAWLIPYEFQLRLGDFSFEHLKSLSKDSILKIMQSPPQSPRSGRYTTLHRWPPKMSDRFFQALDVIENKYAGGASKIWRGTPSEVVLRLLEFRGAGPKIATMAANILARNFKVPLSDHYSIDISLDTHVRRVLPRLGLVEPNSPDECLVYTARALNPEYPGLIDLPLWNIGRAWCKPKQPLWDQCYMTKVCPKRI
jgi:endonuclease III